MIFVTVGTHQQPFRRLIEALDVLPASDLVVQHGHSPRPHEAAEAVAFMNYDEVLSRMSAADVVITHAGVGCILTALDHGHMPVVVPRCREFGEHVDDHQVELTTVLATAGRVVAVEDVAGLSRAVGSVPARTSASATGVAEGPLHGALRAALLGTGARVPAPPARTPSVGRVPPAGGVRSG